MVVGWCRNDGNDDRNMRTMKGMTETKKTMMEMSSLMRKRLKDEK